MNKHTIMVGVGVAVCAVVLASWQVYGARPVPQPQPPVPAVPVVAEKTKASDVPIIMAGIGTVEAYNVVDVHAQVTGTIDRIGFVEHWRERA